MGEIGLGSEKDRELFESFEEGRAFTVPRPTLARSYLCLCVRCDVGFACFADSAL